MGNFFKTVAIVTVFSVSEKFLGFIYRIFMSHTIGSEGVGLYQVALSMFSFLFTIVSSGIPITVSRLMTKYKAQGENLKVRKIITAGLSISLVIAVPITLLILIFNGYLSFLFADKRCLDIFIIIIPGLIFTSVYSVLRGVFWGNRDFLPYSVIELLEEICMIIVGVLLISRATSVYEGAKRAGIAVIASYTFSFTLATIVFFLRKNKLANPVSQFKPLLLSSTPVTIMRTVSSLTMSLVSVILPLGLLSAGFSNSQAMSLYGSAMGQAVPLLFIPSSLIGSFTLVLIPEISENFYRKRNIKLKNDIEKSINFTILLTSLFIPIFLVCGEELGVLVFNSHECGNFLSSSAFLVVFMGLSGITTSILNSLGAENKVLFFYTAGGVLMLLSVWILPKFISIYSLLVGFSFVYAFTSILNLILIKKISPIKPKIFTFLAYSLVIAIPSSIIGFMMEKMILPILGSFFSIILVSVMMVAFSVTLYIAFNLIDFNVIKEVLPSFSKKKRLNTLKD